MSVLAGAPVLGRESLKPFEIPLIRCASCRIPFLHQFVQVLGKDRPDSVKGVVPTQPLALKSSQGVHNHCFPESKLILHHDVNNGMKLQIW